MTIRTLQALKREGVDADLETKTQRLGGGMAEITQRRSVPAYHTRVGSMFSTFFQDGPVFDYASALNCDTDRFGKFFGGMLSQGVNLAPSQFEAGFMSLAHTDEDIERTLEAADIVLASI